MNHDIHDEPDLERASATWLLAAPVPFSWTMRHFCAPAVSSRVAFHHVICNMAAAAAESD